MSKFKIKLFTHTDLDGVGCDIVTRFIAGLEWSTVDTTFVRNPKHASEEVSKFIDSAEVDLYDKVMITDISIDKSVADKINSGFSDKFYLVDHHESALWLNDYHFATVAVTHENGEMTSATDLLLKLETESSLADIHNPRHEFSLCALESFAELVRRYDTWDWVNKYHSEPTPARLNSLISIYGLEDFSSKMLDTIHSIGRKETIYFNEGIVEGLISESDLMTIQSLEKVRDKYLKSKEQTLEIIHIHGMDVGVVFAEQHFSELGNYLYKENPQLDYVAMIDIGRNKVSLRTNKDDVNVSVIAQSFGGGGHAKASGFVFDKEVKMNSISDVFALEPAVDTSDNKTGFLNAIKKHFNLY